MTEKKTAAQPVNAEVIEDKMQDTTALVITADKNPVATVDASTDEGKIDIANALNDALSLADHEGVVINCVDCIIMPGERRNYADNSKVPCEDVYLIDNEGQAYFSQSSGVAKSAHFLVSLYPDFGKSRECGYLPIVLTSRDLPDGRTIKKLKTIKETPEKEK